MLPQSLPQTDPRGKRRRFGFGPAAASSAR
jgi:hypothetical protein